MDAEEASPNPRMVPSDVSSEASPETSVMASQSTLLGLSGVRDVSSGNSPVSGVVASQGSLLGHARVSDLGFGSSLRDSSRLTEEASTPFPETPTEVFATPVDRGQCTVNDSTLTMDELESVPQAGGVRRSTRRGTIVPLPVVAEMDDTFLSMPDSSYRADDPTWNPPSDAEMSEAAAVVATPIDGNVLGNEGIC